MYGPPPELSIIQPRSFSRAGRGCRRAWVRAPWPRRHAPWDSWQQTTRELGAREPGPIGPWAHTRNAVRLWIRTGAVQLGAGAAQRRSAALQAEALERGISAGSQRHAGAIEIRLAAQVPMTRGNNRRGRFSFHLGSQVGLRGVDAMGRSAILIGGKQHHAGGFQPVGPRGRADVTVYADVRGIPAAHRGDVVLEPQGLQGCVSS